MSTIAGNKPQANTQQKTAIAHSIVTNWPTLIQAAAQFRLQPSFIIKLLIVDRG